MPGNITIPNPKVRQLLELMDTQYQQHDLPTFSQLEERLIKAGESNNKIEECELTLQMGVRLLSIAMLSDRFSLNEQFSFAKKDDVLEPAIDLFTYALEIAINNHDINNEKFSRQQIAQCFIQSKQFEKAVEQLNILNKQLDRKEDVLLCFNNFQFLGDCCIELVNDEEALLWYQKAMEIAIEIDDPLEMQVQHAKIAGALENLKRYDEALNHYTLALDLLVRLGNDKSLQQKIKIHKNSFPLLDLPGLTEYTNELVIKTKEAIGRDLLSELPDQIAIRVLNLLRNEDSPDQSDWPVFRELDTAVRTATSVLIDMLNELGENEYEKVSIEETTLRVVGSLCRSYVDPHQSDPKNLMMAARLVMQIDRSRRAAFHVKKAAESHAKPGPFGGGTSRFVVYLRSFIASPHLPSFNIEPWCEVNFEELLACMLDHSPMIALGNPELEQFGPGKAITTDDNWREVLKALAMEAQMLIVIPTPTKGTSWEMEWVVTNKFLHKTCFIMPPPAEAEEAWWVENWDRLRTWSVRLGVNVPEYNMKGCVFRLNPLGLCDKIDLSEIYSSSNLHMTLLTQLLFKINITSEFMYGVQQNFEFERQSENQSNDKTGGDITKALVDDGSAESIVTIHKIEAERRFEFSNWDFDEPKIPSLPGVLLFYESPFRLMWVEEVNDIHEALSQHIKGQVSKFTSRLFWLYILPLLNSRESSQILDKSLSIEEIVSFRIKEIVSYRFYITEDAKERAHITEVVWKGASKGGAPQFPMEADKNDAQMETI